MRGPMLWQCGPDPRAVTDASHDPAFRLELRERIVDGVACDTPVGGEPARRGDMLPGLQCAGQDRIQARAVDALPHAQRAGIVQQGQQRFARHRQLLPMARKHTRKWPLCVGHWARTIAPWSARPAGMRVTLLPCARRVCAAVRRLRAHGRR
jgi:hypothetical protein